MIPYAEVDSTSTSTVFTATIPNIAAYYDGLTILLKNGVVTSASGFTINVNGLGAKPSYSNMATGNPTTPTAPTRDTTIFNINYTMLFTYSSTLVSGGCWICYRGYDANTNTIGYQLRTNSYTLPTTQKFYRYRLLFTSADNTHFVPANTSSSTNATSSRTTNTTPINPFGPILYYGSTTAVEANAKPGATVLWQQYTLTLGYSFNNTGAALVLTTSAPVYIRCTPQEDGSAVMDYFTQSLPTTADGKIYILLGYAYSATAIELLMEHPVYCFKDGRLQQWVNAKNVPVASDSTPSALGTASAGTSSDYSRADHVHQKPTYTATDIGLGNVENVRQYSASNPPPYPVTSVNGDTGAVTIETLPAVSSADNGKILTVVNGVWTAAELPIYSGGVIDNANSRTW